MRSTVPACPAPCAPARSAASGPAPAIGAAAGAGLPDPCPSRHHPPACKRSRWRRRVLQLPRAAADPAPSSHRPQLQALEQAREKGDTIKDEIWRELARAKYTLWQLRSSQRREQQQQLRQQLGQLMAAQLAAAQAQGPEAVQLLERQQEADKQHWERLFAAAGQQDSKQEVPSAYTCPLTMEVYRDPAGARQAVLLRAPRCIDSSAGTPVPSLPSPARPVVATTARGCGGGRTPWPPAAAARAQ
jgi:hypothetical protein